MWTVCSMCTNDGMHKFDKNAKIMYDYITTMPRNQKKAFLIL